MSTPPLCPRCHVPVSYYDGYLGYESFQCPRCHWDVNDPPPAPPPPQPSEPLRRSLERLRSLVDAYNPAYPGMGAGFKAQILDAIHDAQTQIAKELIR